MIKQRRSIRNYKSERITQEELEAILEAGKYAPNAGNEAWHFTVVQNKDLLNRLNFAAKQAAVQSGVEHLKNLGLNENFNCLYDAPALIIISGNQNVFVPLEADCAAALQNMLLAVESIGIGSCWIYFVLMAFRSPQGEDLYKELKIPDGYKPYYAAVFGYGNTMASQAPERKSGVITYIG